MFNDLEKFGNRYTETKIKIEKEEARKKEFNDYDDTREVKKQTKKKSNFAKLIGKKDKEIER